MKQSLRSAWAILRSPCPCPTWPAPPRPLRTKTRSIRATPWWSSKTASSSACAINRPPRSRSATNPSHGGPRRLDRRLRHPRRQAVLRLGEPHRSQAGPAGGRTGGPHRGAREAGRCAGPRGAVALKVAFELNESKNVHTAKASDSQITDDALGNIQGLHQLATLELTGRPITDAGLKRLGAHPDAAEPVPGEHPGHRRRAGIAEGAAEPGIADAERQSGQGQRAGAPGRPEASADPEPGQMPRHRRRAAGRRQVRQHGSPGACLIRRSLPRAWPT